MTIVESHTDVHDVLGADLEYICGKLHAEFLELSGKRLLITGGAGFLGHYLVQSVLHWNRRHAASKRIALTLVDNYVRGVPDWLAQLREDPGLSLVAHDIALPLPSETGPFDYIVHAAGIASPIYYRQHPLETMDANIGGLRGLLDYSQRQGGTVRGFLFFSSSEIYGDPPPEQIPTGEDYRGNVSCTGPRACYDESKRYGETLCVVFHRQHALPVKVARPFNNYGPGLKITDRRVIPDFARDILADRDLVLLSDGSPKRTFCYVADAIVGYYKILVRGRGGEAYNIGVEGPEISICGLAERMVAIAGRLFGYQGKVVRQRSADADYLVDNPNRRCPNIAKARKELGYDPAIPLDEGLRRSLIWYSENRKAEEA
jgi:nucleoside-diphosphate-sugar epimerase